MSNDEPVDGLCNARTRDGGYCGKNRVTGSERCRYHGGLSTGPPEGSANNLKHGAQANPSNLTNHLDDEELAWVEALTDAYLEHAPFERGDPRAERLAIVSVMVLQEWKAHEQIAADGLEKDVTVDIASNGEHIVRTEEHHLNVTASRLNDKIRHNLKELELLPAGKSGGGESMATILSSSSSSSSASEESSDER